MKLFTKQDGSISWQNVTSAVVTLLGLIEIVRPFIPADYLPYALALIGALNFYLRTTSNGSPIVK